MIVEFSVKNFRSISDLQTISFVSTSLKSSKENENVDNNNIVPYGDMRLLKTVGIYGANASGKSNVIKALEFFCETVSLNHNLSDLNFKSLFNLNINIWLHVGVIVG